jgi:3-oxoacyl-[acyl-carrier protein] reductase
MSVKKHILITGTGRGIGLELTLKALKEGHNIYALSRNLNALEPYLEQFKNSLVLIKFDLTDQEAFIHLPSIIKNHTSTIDVIINNAGLLINKPFLQLNDLDWNSLWNVNVLGAVKLIKSLIDLITTNTHIVNISSMGGFQGSLKFAGLSAYSTVKGALSILTECLSVEKDLKGCSINALCLGAVQTEMLQLAFPGYEASVTANEMAEFILNFSLLSGKLMSGKIIPVSINNPD